MPRSGKTDAGKSAGRVAAPAGEGALFNGALPKGITVLTGPACCGKTSAVLDTYRRHSDELDPSRCLVLAPNSPAVAQLRRKLLEHAPTGVLIGPSITTFAGLAAGILHQAGRHAPGISAVGRRLLLGRIVHELKAAGKLRAVGPLADAPGLVTALDSAIAELKRAAVEPESLAGAIGEGQAKDADLLAVYRLYQDRLRSSGRYDLEGRMWLARDVLAADPQARLGCDDLAAIAVDGFTDFTPTQLEMLALLSRRVERLVITLPLAEQPGRRRLWFWTGRTLERIRRAMPDARIVALPDGGDPLPALFDLSGGGGGAAPKAQQRNAVQSTPPGGSRLPDPPDEAIALTVLEAPDVEAEVRAVAAAVKRDLLTGAGAVAVVARDLDGYAEAIERIFAECDIPVGERPRPLGSCGIVRFILRLLALPGEYEFHDLLAVIRNSYFRPSALGKGFSGATAAVAEMVLRATNFLRGRQSCREAFARLARRLAERQEDQEQALSLGPIATDADALADAGALLDRLMDRLDGLADSASAGEYVAGVRRLIADMQLPDSVCAAAQLSSPKPGDEELLAGGLRALAAFDELLEEVKSARPPSPQTGGATSWAELLGPLAAAAACPPARKESLVTVLDALDARGLRFDRLYLLGVNEKAFPRLSQERCLITEADRAAWSARGLPLDRRSDLLGREMLLFYLAVTRARQVTVSYVTRDSAGAGGVASVFVDDLLAAAARQGVACSVTRIPPGQFVPPPNRIASPDDAFNCAVSGAFAAVDGGVLGWAVRHRPETLQRAAFGLLASYRRWRPETIDAFDGRIDRPDLLKELPRLLGDEHVFSATELNAYAQCPWQFFARYLLRVEALDEPARQMTAAARGSFCHAVLRETFAALAGEDQAVELADVPPEKLVAALTAAVESQRRRLGELAVYSQLWSAQTAFWHGMLSGYLAGQSAEPATPGARSRYFEFGFGLGERTGDDRRDPASRTEPVTLDAAGTPIRLRGKIDRVDLVGPRQAPLAVDYKSGSMPLGAEIVAGLDLQLPLYAKALEAIFTTECFGGEYHQLRGGKVCRVSQAAVPSPRGGPKLDYPALMDLCMRAAARCVAGMRSGRFDALPSGKCASWCPYRRICHHSPARAALKRPAPARGTWGPPPDQTEGGDE